ncbi:MAG: penicillin-binding protein activator [Gammaproteobacteria bacterium]
MKQQWLFPILLLVVMLSGCAGMPQPGEEAGPVSIENAERLVNQGRYSEAAQQFKELAGEAPAKEQNTLLLKAVMAMAKAEQPLQARQLLNTVNLSTLDEQQYFLYKLTQANLALAERNPEAVLSALILTPPVSTPSYLIAEFHQLRAEAFTMVGNRLESAREHVLSGPYINNPEQVKQNQYAIWEALAMFSERALQQLRTNPPPDTLSGWMELVQIAKAYQLQPATLKARIQEWRELYPEHPVLEEILANLQNRKQEDVIVPSNIALMLPFSSKFATAAEAVRDGFLAAYYNSSGHTTQKIRILDTGATPENINAIYQQAIGEGAQFVIGPLDKKAIELLVQENDLKVPTLALNNELDDNIPENLFQFGLSPEDEARQVAERTWLDGHVNAAVLVPQGPWGERVYHAFAERWQQIGGKIVEVQQYIARDNDFSQPIRKLMNIDESQSRYRSVEYLLNRKVKFTPRRRQDVDFIFIAAYPRQARQIRPQLKFYHASDLPVYATSHVYTGNLNQERDRDMDGLAFGDMPWVLSESTTHRSLRTELEPYISKAGNRLQRLYALGVDAYNIIAALNTLKRYPYERYDGETGSLSLDGKQRIHRQLTWVKFRSGRPVLKDEGLQ